MRVLLLFMVLIGAGHPYLYDEQAVSSIIMAGSSEAKGEQFNKALLDLYDTLQNSCDTVAKLTRPILLGTVNFDDIRIFAYTQLGFFIYPINCASCLIQSRNFQIDYNTIIFIHGYRNDPDEENIARIAANYFKYPGYNFLSVDISRYTTGSYVHVMTLAPQMGQIIGDYLVELIDYGVNPKSVHIIGYSLGAQIAGIASRVLKAKRGQLISRITALDPAAVCFTPRSRHALRKSDARYVDAIHTSVLSLYRKNVGHADFHVNGNIGQQPGCENSLVTCSHARNLLLYAESIQFKDAFLANRCNNWKNFISGNCSSDYVAIMGAASHPLTRGKFYLKTSGQSPFGLGYGGLSVV